MYYNGKLCDRISGSEPVSEKNFSLFLESLYYESEENASSSIFFATDFNLTEKRTQLIRSMILMRQSDPKETKKEKIEYSKWAGNISKVVENRNDKYHHIFINSKVRASAAINPIALKDLSLAILSIGLVFIVVFIHTTSGILAFSTILQILLSFPLTYFVYRFVIRIRYFAALQIVS